MYYTYVLQSEVDNQFYVGYTKDLKLRFGKHNDGDIVSTKNRRPLKLIYYEACLSQQDALKREKYLKTWHGRQFLHKRLKSYLTGWMGNHFHLLVKMIPAETMLSNLDQWIKVNKNRRIDKWFSRRRPWRIEYKGGKDNLGHQDNNLKWVWNDKNLALVWGL